jgi:hypothetical protein
MRVMVLMPGDWPSTMRKRVPGIGTLDGWSEAWRLTKLTWRLSIATQALFLFVDE